MMEELKVQFQCGKENNNAIHNFFILSNRPIGVKLNWDAENFMQTLPHNTFSAIWVQFKKNPNFLNQIVTIDKT